MSSIVKSSQVRIVKKIESTQDEQHLKEKEMLNRIEEAELLANRIIEDSKLEAESIISQARKDAEKVLEETHERAKNICIKANDDGYNSGFEKGYNEGKIISDDLIVEANQIKKDYFKERDTFFSHIEEDIISMIMSICEKIVNQKLIDDEETIISIVLKGINSLNVKEKLIIWVSKYDYDIVEMSKQRIMAMANLVEDIELRIDSTLLKGGCIIEGSKGNVDVSIETQIEEMKKLLTILLNSE
ncbi:MAG: FliH/SctL family protein [Tissierellales bacterium]